VIAFPIVTRDTTPLTPAEMLAIWRYRSAFAQGDRPLISGSIAKSANTRYDWRPDSKKEAK
jgi:hypothetical protein